MGVRKFWIGVVVMIILLASVGIGVILLYADKGSNILYVDSADINTTNETVIQYANMTDDQQSVFLSALESDSYAKIPEGVESSIWYENRYVKYQGELYRVYVAVVD
jgi:ABC-type Na+ efflux pump permease subunit